MIHVDAALFTSDHVVAFTGLCVFLMGAYQFGTSMSKKRTTAKAIIADKDKTALEQIAADLRSNCELTQTVVTVLEGRKRTPLEPNPPPGLVEVVANHGKILNKLIPNGGNTDNPGDLLLKLARDRGVTEADQ